MFGVDGELLFYFIRGNMRTIDIIKILNQLYKKCSKEGFEKLLC